jgi:hypothetical protein
MGMKRIGMAICVAVGTLVLSSPAFPKTDVEMGNGQAIVTALAKNKAPLNISQQDLTVEVRGKQSTITDWVPLRGPNSDLEMVVLIDSAAGSSLGLQLDDISNFIKSLPSNVKVSVGYMEAGSAVLAGPLSTDHAQVVQDLRIPNGLPGTSASPYFCLSDLAKHWPSTDRSARREVVMITNGVDNYFPRYDPNDPYFRAAVKDAVRAGLVVYPIYWQNRGRFGRSNYVSFDGQSLLAILAKATGGVAYWDGRRNPVSFSPYLDDIARRLQNQYRLSFQTPLTGRYSVESLELKVGDQSAEVNAPQWVLVER